MPGPKLVIIGGSNTLAGIDAQALGRNLSTRVFNFGLSASFGPGLQIFEASKVLKPHDAALLPLEYMAYDYETPQGSLVDTVYSCGVDYWRSLPWREQLFFALAVRPQRIVDSLLFLLKPGAIKQTALLAARDVGPYGQRPGGNFPVRQVSVESGLAAEPLAIRVDPQSAGAAAIVRFVSWARAHKVLVLATWPNTIEFPPQQRVIGLAHIRVFYNRLGVEVVGRPQDAMLPASLMGDRFYHPNRGGMAVRTARLVRSLDADRAFRAWRNGYAFTR